MSNRHYLINSEDLQNLNAKLLSIAFSKDEGDWKSIMHTHHFTELLFVVSGEGSFSFAQAAMGRIPIPLGGRYFWFPCPPESSAGSCAAM